MSAQRVKSLGTGALFGLVTAMVVWTDQRYPDGVRQVAAVIVAALIAFMTYRVIWVATRPRKDAS